MRKYNPPVIPKEAFSIPMGSTSKIKRMKSKAEYPMIDTYPHGAPVGGFGAGTMGRTPEGDMSVWHLIPGYHIYENIPACQFSVRQKIKGEDKVYAQVMSTSKPEGKALSGWNWELPKGASSYSALYPKSWYKYEHKKFPVEMMCTQFSPIIPHNYKETSFPVAVYKWNAYNPTEKVVEVSIMLTWQNMLGWKPQKLKDNTYNWEKNNSKESLNKEVESGGFKGVILNAPVRGDKEALEGEFCIATQQVLGSKVYVQSIFDCESTGEYLWAEFTEKGILKNYPNPDVMSKGAAIIIKITLGPKDNVEIPMAVAWDIPKAHGIQKYYTRFLGKHGKNSFRIAKEALLHYKEWEQQIDAWHKTVLNKKDRPSWYKRMLLNELYYLADGGTIWDAETGHLAYLECFDYVFYDTLDVRYFGGFPLAYLWPEVEKTVMRTFGDTIDREDRSPMTYNKGMDIREKKAHGRKDDPIFSGFRKIKGACPHDLGSPFESLFSKVNAYVWQNSNRWKDLNSKFILQVFRSYVLDGRRDKKFLKELWPAVKQAADYLDELDIDKDHLPENEDFPDQTFDNWPMQGTSAYCGGLRVSALMATSMMGEILNDQDTARKYRTWTKDAYDSYEKKLWNGKYYDFCEKSSDIMAAQLAGPWSLDLLDLRNFIPRKKAKSILKHIYTWNFKKYAKGKLGVTNGRSANGQPVKFDQGNDVWLGVNFMLASHMFAYGMKKEAWKILKSIYNGVYNRGFFFRTPEAWDDKNGFIACMYMRPGTIWAVEYALNKLDPDQKKK